jgi:hypothetical protein
MTSLRIPELVKRNKFPALAAAAAICTAGIFITAPAPAHAFPMVPLDPPPPANCAKFSFGGAFIRLVIPASHEELNFASERSSSYQGPANFGSDGGTATGSINGRDFYLTWIKENSAITITFKGVVNPDGYASGTTVSSNGAPSKQWGSANALFCDDSPAPAPAAAPQAPPPQQPVVPPPPQVYTNAITPSFDGQQTVFKVTLKNSSPLPATCNYEAVSLSPLVPSDTTRTFDVPANGSHTESFNGLKTGTQYKITIPCTDSSGKQTEPLGSVNQTVTW